MHPILRNILAVILGWLGGSLVNGGLVQVGYIVFPIPGVNPEDYEALAAAMPSLEARYFLFPFLAHALGTLSGGLVAYLIAGTRKMTFAMVIGGLFLLGGIYVNYLFRGPVWFMVGDILLAYLPMAWFGGKLAGRLVRH